MKRKKQRVVWMVELGVKYDGMHGIKIACTQKFIQKDKSVKLLLVCCWLCDVRPVSLDGWLLYGAASPLTA